MLNKKASTSTAALLLTIMALVLIGASLFTFLTEKLSLEEDFKDVFLLGDVYKKETAINFYFQQISETAAYNAYDKLSQKKDKVFSNEADFNDFKIEFKEQFKQAAKNFDFKLALYDFEKTKVSGRYEGNREYTAVYLGGILDDAGNPVQIENYIEKIKTNFEAGKYELKIVNGVLVFSLINLDLREFSLASDNKYLEENRFVYKSEIEYELDLIKFEEEMAT